MTYSYIHDFQAGNWTLVTGRTERVCVSAAPKTQEGTWDSEWKRGILVWVEKKNMSCCTSFTSGGGLQVSPPPPPRLQFHEKVTHTPHLYGLIWLLTLPHLLQGGECEDGASGWHRGGRGWRWGRGWGGGGFRLRWSSISSLWGGGVATGALCAAGGEGIHVTPRSSSRKGCLPLGILLGLLPHNLPLPPATLPPEVSVPGGWGRGGWGRLMLLGFPASISETGQRGTKPHPTSRRALDSFL